MRKLLAIVVIGVALAACGDDDSGGSDGNATPQECNSWQDDFDAAEVFSDVEAMEEADRKMQEGGCYG